MKKFIQYIKDFKFTKLQKSFIWVFVFMTIGAFYQKKIEANHKGDKFYVNTLLEYGDNNSKLNYFFNDFSDDMVIGSNDAKITIIEYYSYTCKYCIKFHNEVMPKLKENFIDKGIVKFVYRPVYNNYTINFGAILSCLNTDEERKKTNDEFFNIDPKYNSNLQLYLDDFIKNHNIINETDFKDCIKSDIVLNKIIYNQKKASETLQLGRGVPLFIINEKVHRGYIKYSDLEKTINNIIKAQEVSNHVTKN